MKEKGAGRSGKEQKEWSRMESRMVQKGGKEMESE